MLTCLQIIKNNKGVNFIDVLVSITIFTILITSVVLSLKNINNFSHINSQLDAQDSAKSVLFLMSKDIREAKNFNPANIQPISFAFINIDDEAIHYYLNQATNELIKESSFTPAIPLVPPIITTTLLRDIEPVNASHPRIFDYAGKMISIDIILKKNFITSNKPNMRFKTEVCIRNP